MKVDIYPLDTKRWNDFETLFGERGACGGCWCMSWRLKKSEFEKQKGKVNKEAMKKLVEQNESIGVLAFMWTGILTAFLKEDLLSLKQGQVPNQL